MASPLGQSLALPHCPTSLSAGLQAATRLVWMMPLSLAAVGMAWVGPPCHECGLYTSFLNKQTAYLNSDCQNSNCSQQFQAQSRAGIVELCKFLLWCQLRMWTNRVHWGVWRLSGNKVLGLPESDVQCIGTFSTAHAFRGRTHSWKLEQQSWCRCAARESTCV
jgi:hypothetical protein